MIYKFNGYFTYLASKPKNRLTKIDKIVVSIAIIVSIAAVIYMY